jgi:hypothetical protein
VSWGLLTSGFRLEFSSEFPEPTDGFVPRNGVPGEGIAVGPRNNSWIQVLNPLIHLWIFDLSQAVWPDSFKQATRVPTRSLIQ